MPSGNSSFVLKAPAKINWFLIVNGLRKDGYHEIISLMQMVSVYDEISFEESEGIEIIKDTDKIPASQLSNKAKNLLDAIPLKDNLIYKTVNLLKIFFSRHIRSQGVRIRLKKDIPIAAGLGGGSSDAATTIIGLNKLWGLNLSLEDMMSMGARIGSDVPFFLGSSAAIVRGRGEDVYSVKLKQSYPLLLVKPPVRVETRWAYSEFDKITKGKKGYDPDYPSLFVNILNNGAIDIHSLARNDLEDIVIRRFPEIGEIKDTLKRLGAFFSIMSGSGPTVTGIFDSIEKARQAMNVFPKSYWCRLAETVIAP